ncbi:hypothetical protein LXL04_012621 [Taraxacum kok-saghyz]
MKAIDILCASQAATSIVDYMDSNQQPSSSSSSSSSTGGRAIDRHNPIIQDQKRLTRNTLLPSSITPNKNKKNPKNSDQKRKTIAFADENSDQQLITNKNNSVKNPSSSATTVVRRQGGALLGWGCTRPGDFISPATSSRFLLADKALSDQYDPLLKQVSPPPLPAPEKPDKVENDDSVEKKDDGHLPSSPPKTTPRSSSSLSSRSSNQQVVVLRVSLHCKGCEKKMRKHISKMEGVKDFTIDFMAKKVTVIGDVTPLAVLTSISKVKNAKLLTPTTITSPAVAPMDSDFSEIKKQLGISPSCSSESTDPYQIYSTMCSIVEVTTHTHFPIKLNATNFPVWRKQVMATLIGLGLDTYVDGSKVAPSKTLASDATKPNPEYRPWLRQDQIILGALIGSCSDTIQPLVSSAETSYQAFKRLTESYAGISRSRIISLKSRLANNPKGNRPVAEFLHDMKTISDDLSLAQSPVDEEDLIVHVLSQLGDDYAHIAAALKIRDTTITFPDLFEKLVDFERTLKETQPAPAIIAVNNTQQGQHRQPRFQGQQNTNNFSRGNRNSYCQYCNIPGHDTKECRKLARFLKENNITISSNTSASVNTTSASSNSAAAPPWMFDSGASHHVASNPASFHTLSDCGGPDEIVLGNGTTLPISHVGHTSLPTQSRSLNLPNTLYVPNLKHNLISIAKLCKTNHVSVEFFPYHFIVKDLRMGACLMRGVNINDLYYAAINSLRCLPRVNSVTTTSLHSWHHKLGHPSIKVFKMLLKHLKLDSNKMSSFSFHCNSCLINKSHKQPFGPNTFHASKPLELIYSNVWGPVKQSNDGYLYYVIFVDYFSKYTWLYPLKRKSDVKSLFPQFKSLVEKYYSTPIVSIFTDNGGEYIALTTYLQANDISHFTTPPHTPEQNGIDERRHRHIVETGPSLLHHAKLPLPFWSHAFQTAVHLINRLPNSSLEFKSPFEKLHNTPPTYQKLKSFGCLCFPWLRPYAPSKLHPRSTKCIFLGYSSSKSVYKCFDPLTSKLYHSRHVEFVEHEFPYIPDTYTATPPTTIDFIPPTTSHTPAPLSPSNLHRGLTPTSTLLPSEPQPQPTLPQQPTQTTAPPSTPIEPIPPASSAPPTPQISSSPIARTSPFPPPRNRKQNPKYYNENLINTTTLHPIPSTIEPSTHTQALKDPKWRHAMDLEFNALLNNHTWELVPPTTTKPIGCKWVFRVKRKPDGSIDKYKARLFDINNAFLQGTLHEEVFMAQPPGYNHPDFPNHICKLKKSIYGLKQAPRAWYTELTNFLLQFDDIILTSNNNVFLNHFIQALSNKFSLKDLGTLHHFLGVEVIPTSTGLFLSQHRHIQDVLTNFHMEGAKDVSTPLSASETLTFMIPPLQLTLPHTEN